METYKPKICRTNLPSLKEFLNIRTNILQMKWMFFPYSPSVPFCKPFSNLPSLMNLACIPPINVFMLLHSDVHEQRMVSMFQICFTGHRLDKLFFPFLFHWKFSLCVFIYIKLVYPFSLSDSIIWKYRISYLEWISIYW